MPPTQGSRASRSASGKSRPEWMASSAAPRRSGSRRVNTGALEQFDAAATLDAPGTPQLRDSPGTPTSPRVTFRDDALFAANVDAHPVHVSHALRGRAEGLRIQAEMLEREAAHHETRHKLEQGESCGASTGGDLVAAWDKSVKAIEQLCGAAVTLCISASNCGGAAQAPRPMRSSTPRLSALKAGPPPGLAPVRSYERPLPLAEPGLAPPAQEQSLRVPGRGVPPQRMPSSLRRSSSGILLPAAEPAQRPVRELTRGDSAPLERRSRSVPAAPEGPSMWRRALRNLSNARKPAAAPAEKAPAEKGEFATGSGSPRSQTRFNFT